MERIEYRERLESVRRILNKVSTIKGEARARGVDKNVMKFWVKLYQYHGDDGLKDGEHKPVRWKAEDKQKILDYYHTHNLSVLECAAKFQLSNPSTLHSWLKKEEK